MGSPISGHDLASSRKIQPSTDLDSLGDDRESFDSKPRTSKSRKRGNSASGGRLGDSEDSREGNVSKHEAEETWKKIGEARDRGNSKFTESEGSRDGLRGLKKPIIDTAARGKQTRRSRGGLFCDSEDDDREIDGGREGVSQLGDSSGIAFREGKQSGGPKEKRNDGNSISKGSYEHKTKSPVSLEDMDSEIGGLKDEVIGNNLDSHFRRPRDRTGRGASAGSSYSEARKALSQSKGAIEGDFDTDRFADKGSNWQHLGEATTPDWKEKSGAPEKQRKVGQVNDRAREEDARTALVRPTMKESDRSSGRQGKNKVEPIADSKLDFWMEGKEATYRGGDSFSRRRESRWDEPDTAKRLWHGSGEEKAASLELKGQRIRSRERSEMSEDGSRAGNDGREADRTEDSHRKNKDVAESMREDLEGWERSNERRRDYRDEDDKGDRHRSSKDGDIGLDSTEVRGRSSGKLQEEDEEFGDKSRPKDGNDFYWDELDDRRRSGGWKSAKPGRGVKRSWSPDGRRRGRVEHDDFEREWSDDRRDERVYRRDYDRDRDGYRDRDRERERDYRDREAYREDFENFRDRTRDRDDTDLWKRRQRDRQRDKEEDLEYNYERDGWETHRRERDKVERAQRSGEDRKDEERIDALKSPQSSGIINDTVERVGANSMTSADLGRKRGFAVGSPFMPQRGDTGPPVDFGSNSDADWMGMGHDERGRLGDGFSIGNEPRDRYPFEEEGPPGLDQNFGPTSSRVAGESAMAFNMHSGRGRGPKGSPGQRGCGVPMGGDGRPPFASNQGSAMMLRGMQQSGKAGRGRGGGKGGRGGGRESQRGGGLPPPMMGPGPGPGPGMAPQFGHMGPPGSIPVMGPNMGPGPAPGMGPAGFPLPPFVGPMGWTAGRGAADMGMLPGPPGPVPVPAPGAAPPRFGPSMGPGPGPHNAFFTPSGPGRGTPNVMPGPAYGGLPVGGRGVMQDKAPMARLVPKINAPAGRAPSRGEQNDYSQHFVDTGLRPQNFIRDVDLADRFEEYPKLKELITRKDKLIKDHACPPMYMQMDLRMTELSPDVFGTKFDVILVDPPWEEYVRRAPGVGDSMEWWSLEEIQSLRIEAIADTPSFIFLWVGDAEGLDQGRLCLKKWGFRRCEDICWVKTNRENPTPALRHDASTLLQHSKEHCLMGIKGTVRRSSDGHIIHANIDTDIIISEEPPYGSTAKPEELYHIVEHFAQGQRRLELFGEDHNIRAGWITVGKNLTSSNFNAQTYGKYIGDGDGKVWQGGRGNPPVDASHLVGTTPEIEALRPKSPPPRAQQQQQSQAANSASQPSAANSNSKKPPNASQGMSPQNAQAVSNPGMTGPGQATPMSSVIVISSLSPTQGPGPLKNGNAGQLPKTRRSPLSLGTGPGITVDGGLEDEKSVGVDAQPLFPDEEALRPSKEVIS